MSRTYRSIRPRCNCHYSPKRWSDKEDRDTTFYKDKNGIPDPSDYDCKSMNHLRAKKNVNRRGCGKHCHICWPHEPLSTRKSKISLREQKLEL